MARRYEPYKNQNFEALRQECLQSGSLFEDAEFPATEENIVRFTSNSKGLVWKRPGELVDFLGDSTPQLICNGICIQDLDQGTLGDCWLISSMASIAQYPEYASVVIPEDQSFDEGQYAGIFHFHIWKWGKWYDVVVDDRIPVSPDGIPQYCHNAKDRNEFFGPLLEKAFAKIAGCYEMLVCGDTDDGMIDLTGGVHECFDLTCARGTFKPSDKDDEQESIRTDKGHLWEILFRSKAMKSLAGTYTKQTSCKDLITDHAYSVLNAFEILAPDFSQFRDARDRTPCTNSLKLVHVRNPWGKQVWQGRWGLNSSEWSRVSENVQNTLVPDESEGEFFMSFDDFVDNFNEIRFVHVNMNAYDQDDSPGTYGNMEFAGAWVAGVNSGGCGNDGMELYWTNPQFYLNMPPTREKRSLIVSLMNTESERLKLENRGDFAASNPPIHWEIFKIVNPCGSPKAGKYTEDELQEVGSTGTYMGKRDLSRRFDLDGGEYVIVPSQFTSNTNLRFLLRLFYETFQDEIVACEIDGNSTRSGSAERPQKQQQQQQDRRQPSPRGQPQQPDERYSRDEHEQEQFRARGGPGGFPGGRGFPGGGGGGGRGGRGGHGGRRRQHFEQPVYKNSQIDNATNRRNQMGPQSAACLVM